MANERITESIVRDHFKNDPLFRSVKFEEQKSSNKRVTELLQKSSKSGKGIGKPEFIITFPTGNIDYLLVVECKASVACHRSSNCDKPTDYAVDGVLHYAKLLSVKFDVVAIAVSGQTEQELKISHFLWKKGEKKHTEKSDKKLLAINDYIKLFNNEHFSEKLKYSNIVLKAIELNEEYNNYSIPEQSRNTMVSIILLSLLHKPFRESYLSETSVKSLGKSMINSIENAIALSEVRNREAMTDEFNKIFTMEIFVDEKIKNKKEKEFKNSLTVLKEMIKYLHNNVYPLVKMEDTGFDVLGQFYTEFIRYSASQQKQGLVLTPFHITDLFCDLAQLNVNDIIYDPCCGTAGFLVSGMKRLLRLAGNDDNRKQNIKKEQLIGVEKSPSMYVYACSNMLLKGDGKSNIYRGDCFQTVKEIQSHKPTIAFLNPPYDVGNARQMEFIEHALEIVAPQNGLVAAIVQMSCAIRNEKELIAVKKRILDKYHLKAVLSMPDDLFYPVGVVTSVMLFETNKPNKGLKTWFGYFKDDGLEKRKNQGRIDAREKWNDIKKKWTDAYKNSEEVAGLSVKQEVTENDEWCAEAYMKTDYSTLCDDTFIKTMREYVSFKVLNNKNLNLILEFKPMGKKIPLNAKKWQWVKLEKIFSDFERGIRLTKPNREKGDIPLITAGLENEGVAEYISNEEMKKYENAITIDMFGNSFYREYTFCCDDNILVLPNKNLNKYSGIFIATIINSDNYKFAYGRQYRQKNFRQHEIKLPVVSLNTPDWQYMEDYIKGLPYSKCL